MSAQPKYMAQKSIAICEHPPQESIDWKYYQGLANQEFPLSANLEFSEESKNQIVAALDLLRRNVQSSSARVKLGDLKKRASEILAILKDRSNQEVDENLHLVPDLDVFEQILLNDYRLAPVGSAM